MYNVKFLPSAENEMYEIVDYIANELMNVPAAEKLINSLIKARDNLKIFPKSHTVFNIIKSIEVRRAVVLYCSMFYIIDEKAKLVTIINVKHNLTNFTNTDINI